MNLVDSVYNGYIGTINAVIASATPLLRPLASIVAEYTKLSRTEHFNAVLDYMCIEAPYTILQAPTGRLYSLDMIYLKGRIWATIWRDTRQVITFEWFDYALLEMLNTGCFAYHTCVVGLVLGDIQRESPLLDHAISTRMREIYPDAANKWLSKKWS